MSALWDGQETVVPAALRGYRSWNVGDGTSLWSTGVHHEWTAAETRARCLSEDVMVGFVPDCPCDLCARNTHASPVAGCTCGIYGWYRPDDARLVPGHVFGVVEATGRVVLASHGFRAESVRIVALAVEPGAGMRGRYRSSYSLGSFNLGNEGPDANELHEVARWAKAQGIPVFPTRAELLAAYPPEDVTSLVQHDCNEECSAHSQHFGTSVTITYNGRRISGFSAASGATHTFSLADAPELESGDSEPPTLKRCRHRWHTALLLWAALGLGLGCYGLISDGLTVLNAAAITVNAGLGGYWLRHHVRRHCWRKGGES